MSRFLNKKFDQLEPYVPGEQPTNRNLLKLNTNESPYPPSPQVVEAISRQEVEDLRLYSDPTAKALIGAISEQLGVAADQVVVGNGSDELLAFAFLAFHHERGICFPSVSYGFYPVFARLFQVPAVELPLGRDFCMDLEGYQRQKGTILIANPNAPTGIAIRRSEVEELVQSDPRRLVIVDEAYVDFGGESCVPLIHHYDNLLVVQTFSKSRSLAGGRIGFAMGNPDLIRDLNRIKDSFNPYNVNRLSLIAGEAAMRDSRYFRRCTAQIVETRERTKKQLEQMGFTVLDSKANFLFVRHPHSSGRLYAQELRKRDILVRHWEKEPIEEFVRITVGTPEQMARFGQSTAEILAQLEQKM